MQALDFQTECHTEFIFFYYSSVIYTFQPPLSQQGIENLKDIFLYLVLYHDNSKGKENQKNIFLYPVIVIKEV